MVLSILGVLLFEFKSHLTLVHPFFFKRFRILLQYFEILFNDFLVVCLLSKLDFIFLFKILEYFFVLFGDFLNKHTIVSSTTVFKQNGEDFPDVGDDLVLFVCVLKTLFNEFVKADTVDEKCPINTVDHVCWYTLLD